MELNVAMGLVKPSLTSANVGRWFDLGAGSGLFTQALATVLDGGIITAVDKDKKALDNIPSVVGKAVITKKVADFAELSFESLNADGILMANALHFVKDKISFLNKVRGGLKKNGLLMIIEYEMTKPNPWVPWPISFDQLDVLLGECGFVNVRKIGTAPSRYQTAGIYSAVATTADVSRPGKS